jgi:hypothetical protein
MFGRSKTSALVLCLFALSATANAQNALRQQPANEPPVLEATPKESVQPASLIMPQPPAIISASAKKENAARVWANEPPLVRLAREKFGAELTETDAKFFAAVAANDWADFRPSSDATFDPETPKSWSEAPVLKADCLNWLCTDAAAIKLVPSHGVWLRGAKIDGRIELYRTDVPFSLTFYDCLFDEGINIAHAKLQELDIRNSCSAAIHARAVQTPENIYLLTTCVFGGLDFIDANIGGDFDFTGGVAYHSMRAAEFKKPGVAINFHDGKVGGDIKLGEKFRAVGQVRLIGTTIGRSLTCGGGTFQGNGESAIDARRATIGANAVFTTGFQAEGGVELRRAKIGGDLDCNGGRFIAANAEALDADLVEVGGQVLLGDGYHAEGETRLVNAAVTGDLDADNGHFLHADGDALSLDGATIGRSLRIALDQSSPTDEAKDLPKGFLTRGTFRLWSTQVNQDVLADGAHFESPTGMAMLACNLKVASRLVLTGVHATGTVNLFSADVGHELDLRGGQYDGTQAFNKIAFWANGMQVHGHVFCNQADGADPPYRFVVRGLTSFQFATISMHWDLYGAELTNPGGDALDASDCRVGGYVNIDTVKLDGRVSFSRAKIDGMWILNRSAEPDKMQLDLRFAHIWVIKDERLNDWPSAGHLQLEGLVYDHFDDDSPLDVNDRLAWLRRQYPQVGRQVAAKTAASNAARSRAASIVIREARVQRAEVADLRDSKNEVAITGSPIQLVQHTTQDDRYAVAPAEFEAPAPTAPSMPAPVEGKAADNKSPSTAKPVKEVAAAESVTENKQDATTAKAVAEQAESPAEPASTSSGPAGRRYVTQPYTQLAAVYRAIGQDEQANAVLVARAERLGELAPRFSAQALWYRYLGRLIGYGYEPFRAIKIGLVIIAIGAIVFAIGARRNLMAETKLAEQVLEGDGKLGLVSPTYPRFNPLVYSLDVFLPFVELNQVCYWIPGEKPSKPRKSRNCFMHIGPYSVKWSALLHCYLWFQTLAGWTLCTLLAAAVTGIVQS